MYINYRNVVHTDIGLQVKGQNRKHTTLMYHLKDKFPSLVTFLIVEYGPKYRNLLRLAYFDWFI